MEYLGLDVGYGWWKPAASKMQPLQDMQIRDDRKKGPHDVSVNHATELLHGLTC